MHRHDIRAKPRSTPLSSHMGGAWERLIGITRRILDSILFDAKHTRITHEVLSTFKAEATGIINDRPLVPVYAHLNSPWILSSSTLLTQKTSAPVEDFHDLDLDSIYTNRESFFNTYPSDSGQNGDVNTYRTYRHELNGKSWSWWRRFTEWFKSSSEWLADGSYWTNFPKQKRSCP